MKRTTVAILSVIGGLATIVSWTWADVEGSKHDFSSKEWSGGDACSACHTPASDEAPEVAPAWNPSADLNRTFGTSLRASKLAGLGTTMCLRCHDGTIARDTITSSSKGAFLGTERLGLFRSGHGGGNHPVGVDYPAVDSDYRAPSTVTATSRVVLPNGKVECSSCHDPHDMSGEPSMLVMSNARSALCLSCHKK